MCGLIGIGGERGPELLPRFLSDLAHRGPDDEGRWTSPELTLGHRRLAIIGLDRGGRQPMVSPSGESVINFNGEIYNYLEIADRLEKEGHGAQLGVDRRYDTAVLLAALETWGTAILPDLNGMFAFAWYRPRQRRLLLVRDRWGKKPLFWGRVDLGDNSKTLVFSSELRTFTNLPGGPPEPDPLGVARYLVYDGMSGSTTVYNGVAKVAAASWVELDPDGNPLDSGRYWQVPEEADAINPENARERFENDLRRSFDLRLRSDVPVGLFLSGGIDSSLLAATWRRLRPDDRVRTFTVGFDERSYDERSSARLMAEAVGAEHHEILATGADLERELDAVWNHLSEPFADPSILPMSLLCRFAREKVTVALGGDGADELQAGYDPFRAWRPARLMERVLPRALWYQAGKLAENVLPVNSANMSLRFKARHFTQGFLHPADERIQGWMAGFPLTQALSVMDPDLADAVDPEEVLAPTRNAFRAVAQRGELLSQINAWIQVYLECSILTKVDRAGMMHSLEVRAPFLDPGLAENLLRLPDALIFKGGKGKALMRRSAQHLLPPELLSKPKKGLGVPQAAWLRTILRERFEDCLTANRSGGWFRHESIDTLWRRHLAGRADYRRGLWTFLFAHPFQHHT